jgi:hypothetical protein
MKGDYWRYLAEFAIGYLIPHFLLLPCYHFPYPSCAGSGRKEAAEHSLTSYKSAQDIALTDLQPTHPIRLGLALNFRFTATLAYSPLWYHSFSHASLPLCQRVLLRNPELP